MTAGRTSGTGSCCRARRCRAPSLLVGLDRLLPDLGPIEGLRAAHLPLSPGRAAVRDGRVLLVGDALGLVNPLSGEGISYAVISGALAGRAATMPGDPGTTYRRALKVRLGRHLRDAALMHRLNRWPSVLDAGVRAAADDDEMFQSLVRFGLADGGVTLRALRGTVREPSHGAAGSR
ncbi:hypothetical protein GCM10025868_35480 [Angustibacter aerolatus]|uniref:FAD-binding domain-containing protein n=1 Tax=Angustibacter aerolatus TaxID=1162965 RepID=A0ABQ6JJX2_9ACTN|nr:hypothetical protein GCM10025868_35480 [Angustibacter aerolatus]